ncbi:MAG: hypothetical protein MUP52_13020 [Candidatus Aminicenantes bacterium]|nr:hypothetical protein [Candidatus Aminicenantes bacterium]
MSEENPDTGSVLGSNIEMDFNQTYKFDAAELSRRGEKIKFCKERRITNPARNSRWEKRKCRQRQIGIDICRLFIEDIYKERPIVLKELIAQIEKDIILLILDKVQGNQKKAAYVLGMKYTTLYRKLGKYHIRFIKEPFLAD